MRFAWQAWITSAVASRLARANAWGEPHGEDSAAQRLAALEARARHHRVQAGGITLRIAEAEAPQGRLRMQLIGYENTTIKDGLMNPVSTIRYKASDGLEIEAIVTMPRLRAGPGSSLGSMPASVAAP